jgi:23S rRNA (cytosine1962-C5)-methyltransferase
MNKRNLPGIIITRKGEISVNNGHPWIYQGEIIKHDSIINGDIGDVYNADGKYLGTGFYNDNSKITVRLLTRDSNVKINEDFYIRRLEYAWNYRKAVMYDLNAVRIVFGEADGLPGLTIDKFNDILVCQILSLGIEKNKDLILPNLVKILAKNNIMIKGIYERNDVKIRALEGMEEYTGWYNYGATIPDKTTTEIIENNLKYLVDFKEGQKTGYFLDQKINRLAVKDISKGLTVLDCCTHTGSFAMNAYLGGAKKVVATDISKKALDDAQINFKLNNMQITTIEADIFDLLKELAANKKKEYDLIILDPPAFTKSRKTIDSAMKGYEELNYLAMKALPRGGFLVTASCSHFASETLFKNSIMDAARKANVALKQVLISGAAPDHPVLWGVPETEYLHFIILQII